MLSQLHSYVSFMTRLSILVSSLLLLVASLCAAPANAQSSMDNRYYELRVYTAHPDKRDALLERFRRHTVRLFTRHDIFTVGHWVPTDDSDKLYYLVSYAGEDKRDAAWQGFLNDPEWKTVFEASRQDGPLVANIESTFLALTDYSVPITPSGSDAPRFFELRIYTAEAGKLSDLHARFRNHTVEIFSHQGMQNIGYWRLTDNNQEAENTLLYILAYKDRAERDQTWGTFRTDPAWVEAKTNSEKNGKLVAAVESIFMVPTDYSPIH